MAYNSGTIMGSLYRVYRDVQCYTGAVIGKSPVDPTWGPWRALESPGKPWKARLTAGGLFLMVFSRTRCGGETVQMAKPVSCLKKVAPRS